MSTLEAPQVQLPDGPGAIFVRCGNAAVSYVPGHEVAEVEFAVHGRRTDCTADEALQLAVALIEALEATPRGRT